MNTERAAANAALGFILVVALAWRLVNIGFGLPSLYDPDEPMFMVMALTLLKEGTLNPGWFGHPGSTTIYLLALIDVVVVVGGLLTGRFANTGEFAAAAYANPALLFIPSRVAMVILGVACVWLTYLVARRLWGIPVALVAAALLAINPLHIAWSQVVRTDIHATVFMLACILFAVRISEHGRMRDYLIAGAFVGLAAATKWPAASVAIAVIGAFAYRCLTDPGGRPRQARALGAAGASAVVALFLASPYIFLDWQTVLANVSGEARPSHLGHTGRGFLSNLDFYLRGQVGGSMGLIGLALAVGGAALTFARRDAARWTILPAAGALLVLICSQSMVWSRWVLPLLPLFCIFAAVAIVALAQLVGRSFSERRRAVVTILLFSVAAIPSLAGAWAGSIERGNDTRTQAADWARANVPAGSTVVLEHLELSLRSQPWRILFPIGDAGCIDALKILTTGVRYENVQKLRNSSPIVDLGNVSSARIASCRADYAILTYYNLYRTEADRFPRQIETYRQILAGGRTVALFRPHPGVSGGPVVRIVAMR